MALSKGILEMIANDLFRMVPRRWKSAKKIIDQAYKKWQHTGASWSDIHHIGSSLVDAGVILERAVVRADGVHASDWRTDA